MEMLLVWVLVAVVLFLLASGGISRSRRLEAARRSRPLPGMPERLPAITNAADGWSAEWGAWPSEPDEEEMGAEREEIRPEAPVPIVFEEAISREIAPRDLPPPAVAPVIISLEPVRVDRRAEHERLHRLNRATPAPDAPPPIPLATQLRQRSELRRALILAEVIGPPRSLQPPDPHG